MYTHGQQHKQTNTEPHHSVSLFFIELNIKDPNLAVTFKSSFDMIKINFASFDIVSKCREFSAHTLKREFLSFSYIGHVIIK